MQLDLIKIVLKLNTNKLYQIKVNTKYVNVK